MARLVFSVLGEGRRLREDCLERARVCTNAVERKSWLTRRRGIAVLVGATAVIATAMLMLPVAEPPSYHNFADQRGWLGISNFGDVASNIAFAMVGVWGLDRYVCCEENFVLVVSVFRRL
jgi:hypothetical protein